MEFTLAKIEGFNEVQNLYWNLIDRRRRILSQEQKEGIEAIHLDVIDKITDADN